MPRLTLDMKDAVSLKALEDGTYPAEVIEVQGPNAGEKSTYITLVWEVNEGDAQGRRLFDNLMIDGKASGRTAEVLSKLLGEEIDPDEMDEFDFDTDDLIGAQGRIVVSQREYPEGSGEMRNEVKRVLRPA